MRSPLSIAACQPEIRSGDLAGNVERHAKMVLDAQVRVAVFPELSLTGYELESKVVELSDPTISPLVDACRQTGTTALVGAPTSGSDGREFISILAVNPQGVSLVYSKQWPSDEESVRFNSGDRSAVLDIDGWHLGLAICRDSGIASHVATTTAMGIDAYVYGIVEASSDSAKIAARAKGIAMGNNIWVVASSFAGSTGSGYDSCAGLSGIWRPDGSSASQASAAPGTYAATTLSD